MQAITRRIRPISPVERQGYDGFGRLRVPTCRSGPIDPQPRYMRRVDGSVRQAPTTGWHERRDWCKEQETDKWS
jgi:hypothetical protein